MVDQRSDLGKIRYNEKTSTLPMGKITWRYEVFTLDP